MKRWVPFGAALALLLLALALPTLAGAPACTAERPNISNECLTTADEDCIDAIGESVTVQIGGPGAKDSNGDGGLCVSTHAVALLTFTRVSATQVRVRIDNRTCDDSASITALFHNITESATGYTLVSVSPVEGTRDLTWNGSYSQTSAANDGLGFRADGFGNFDAAIYNGNNTSPNGGNKLDIRAGEIFDFTLNVSPGFDLCDFLTELSTPPPGDRNRNAVGRFQACGPDEENSAYVGPCEHDGELLAVIDGIRLIAGDRKMRLEWSTSLEIENAGFNVLRREATRGGWERINPSLLPGQGDTVSGADYAFVDDTALNGVEYMYRVEDIDFDGKNNLSDIRKDVANPSNPQFKLRQPAYGASVDLASRPRFAFDGGGAQGNLVLQISGDPSFPEGSTLSTHVPRRLGSSEFTLDRRTSQLVSTAAGETDGIVYWRLVDRSRTPLSDTFRMEIQDAGDIASGGADRRVGVGR